MVNGMEAKPTDTPDAIAASCINFGRNEYVRLSRNTARKKTGLTTARLESSAAALSSDANTCGFCILCIAPATCRKRPARNADAMNRAAKFLTLRVTRSKMMLRRTVTATLVELGWAAGDKSI